LIDLVLDDSSKSLDAVAREGEDLDAIDIVNPQQRANSTAIRANTAMTNSNLGGAISSCVLSRLRLFASVPRCRTP